MNLFHFYFSQYSWIFDQINVALVSIRNFWMVVYVYDIVTAVVQ